MTKNFNPRNSKLAIIGLGSIGLKHLLLNKKNNLAISPEVHVLKRTSTKIEDEYLGLIDKIYTDIDRIKQNKYDHVIISSPASFHYHDYFLMRNSANKFLLEKPLSFDCQSANKILHNVDIYKHRVYVGYVFRFSPAFSFFKSLLKNYNSRLQNVTIESHSYLPLWRKNKNYTDSVSSNSKMGGGVLRELSHELDLLIHLFGYPSYVFAKTESSGMVGIDVEHSCISLLLSPHSVPIQLSLSFNNKVHSRFIRVKFVDGYSIVWNLLEGFVATMMENTILETQYFPDDYTVMFENQNNFFLDHQSSCSSFDPASVENGVEVMRLIREIKHSNQIL